jgi:hypothetical protein
LDGKCLRDAPLFAAFSFVAPDWEAGQARIVQRVFSSF